MTIETFEESIIRGDSTKRWLIEREDDDGELLDLSDYTCALKVETTAIDRIVNVMTTDNLAFVAGLTRAETAMLSDMTSYKVLVVLESAALDYRNTIVVWLHVLTQ